MLVSDENEAGPSVGSQPREWSACADSFGTDGCRRPQCFIVLQSREEDLAPLHGLQESSLFAVALVIVSDCVRVSRGLVSVCVTPGATRPGPPFTTEFPCANGCYERGLPRPRSLKFQRKVCSVAEVRVA